jgi:hypothetical protein
VNADARWIERCFQQELPAILHDTNPPLHVVDRRLRLIEMVIAEVGDDDLEGMAVRALADATRDYCLNPDSGPVLEAWATAIEAHLEILKAGYGMA